MHTLNRFPRCTMLMTSIGSSDDAKDARELRELLSSAPTHLEVTKATKNTRQWFVHSAPFKSWREKDASALMWVSAGPGCGKSVLCRYLIDSDQVRAPGDVFASINFFFFKDGITNRDTAESALASLIHQIVIC